METEFIKARLRSALGLKDAPRLVSFQQRKHSAVFEVDCGQGRFILKLPRKSREEITGIEELRPEEKHVAKAKTEWKSLCHLHRQTQDPRCPVAFVEPIAFVEELPGVVTRKIDGTDLYRSRLLSARPSAIRDCEALFRKIGTAFAFLHACNRLGSTVVAFSEEKLGDRVIDDRLASASRAMAEQWVPTVRAMTGFSLTDVIVDRDGELFFLDPGKFEERVVYEDLAKFTIELRKARKACLLPVFLKPGDRYEDAFLEGYTAGGGAIDSGLLGLYMAHRLRREILKVRQKNKGGRLPAVLNRKTRIEAAYCRYLEKMILRFGL